MRFRVLGTLEVFNGNDWQTVPAAKCRALLAALLVEPGRVVSLEQAAAQIWEGSPPRTVANQVYGYVGRLRRLLGDTNGRIVVTHSPAGHRLEACDDEVDARRFVVQTAAGMRALRSGNHDHAARLLAAALALWRGPAFADVAATDTIRAAAEHLGELRVAALEARIEADLACGRHAELATELHALTRDHPLREGLWRLRMLTLYRCDRQAEALAAYQSVRDILGEELGIEPSLGLRELHHTILRGRPDHTQTVEVECIEVKREPAVAPRPSPAQWPFAGQPEELRRLLRLSQEPERDHVVVILMIPGTAETESYPDSGRQTGPVAH